MKFLLRQCNIFSVETESHCAHSSNEFYLTFAWIFSFSLCKHLLNTLWIFLSNYCKLNTREQKQISEASALVSWTWQCHENYLQSVKQHFIHVLGVCFFSSVWSSHCVILYTPDLPICKVGIIYIYIIILFCLFSKGFSGTQIRKWLLCVTHSDICALDWANMCQLVQNEDVKK